MGRVEIFVTSVKARESVKLNMSSGSYKLVESSLVRSVTQVGGSCVTAHTAFIDRVAFRAERCGSSGCDELARVLYAPAASMAPIVTKRMVSVMIMAVVRRRVGDCWCWEVVDVDSSMSP